MPSEIQLHDVVALVEDVPATHFLTHKPLQLRRGQIGTVVMLLEDSRFQVEFSDSPGSRLRNVAPAGQPIDGIARAAGKHSGIVIHVDRGLFCFNERTPLSRRSHAKADPMPPGGMDY